MRKKIDPVVDEAIETLNMKDGPSRRRLIEGAGLFSATAAASALIAACSFIELKQRRPEFDVVDGGGCRGQLPDHAQVEVHVREPRHGQLVLHARPSTAWPTPPRCSACPRRPGRAPCPPSRRTPPCCRPSSRGHGRFSRHRDHRGLGHGVRRAHQQRAAGGHPGGHLQRERCQRQPHQRPGLRRPGAVAIGPGGGQAARLADEEGRHRGRLHRPARLAEHPAAHGRRHAGPGGRRHEGHVRQQGLRHGRLGDAGSPGAARSSSSRTGPRSRASSRSTAATPPCSAPRCRSTTWSARCTPAASTWSRRP